MEYRTNTMGDSEEKIKNKLAKLEASLQEDEKRKQQLANSSAGQSDLLAKNLPIDQSKLLMSSDLHCLGGCALLILALLMVFNHTHIGTGMMTLLGFGHSGGGFLMMPILVGIGFLFYDYKNKLGWLLTGGGIVLLLFAILSQLVIYFPHLTLLSFIFMFMPMAIGIALLAKGIQIRQKIEQKAPSD